MSTVSIVLDVGYAPRGVLGWSTYPKCFVFEAISYERKHPPDGHVRSDGSADSPTYARDSQDVSVRLFLECVIPHDYSEHLPFWQGKSLCVRGTANTRQPPYSKTQEEHSSRRLRLYEFRVGEKLTCVFLAAA